MNMQSIVDSPNFREGVFLFAVLLLLGGFKFSIEGIME